MGGSLWLTRYQTEGRARLAQLLSLPEAALRTAARGKALYWAGHLAYSQGDWETAWALTEESLDVRREVGNPFGVGQSLTTLGWIARNRGDLAKARALHEESLAVFQAMQNPFGIAWEFLGLGHVARLQGDLNAARGRSNERLRR